MLRALAVLLLTAATAAAQVSTRPPGAAGGGSFSGGTITAPILGPLGCVTPAYAFSGAADSGLCSTLANSPILQSRAVGSANGSWIALGTATNTVAATNAAGTANTAMIVSAAVTPSVSFTIGGVAGAFTLGGSSFTSTLPFLAPTSNTAYSFSAFTAAGLGTNGTDVFVLPVSGSSLLRVSPLLVALEGANSTSAARVRANAFTLGAPHVELRAADGATVGLFTVYEDRTEGDKPLRLADGTVAAPSYSFTADTTTGLYQILPGLLGVSLAGANRQLFYDNEFRVGSGVQLTFSAAATAAGGAADTGLARDAAGVLRVTDGGAGNGSLRIADGSEAAPGLAFSSSTGSGLWFTSSNLLTSINGTRAFNIISTGTQAIQYQFPSTVLGSASDTGLARSEAAVVRATNGSTGLGYVLSGVSVEANTGTKAPTVIESGELYTNTGDADGSTINLPDDPTIGTTYTVTATVAQNITLAPAAGETIMFGNTTCGTSFVIGGAASGIGDSVTVVAATGGAGAVWITTASAGTPVCTP